MLRFQRNYPVKQVQVLFWVVGENNILSPPS